MDKGYYPNWTDEIYTIDKTSKGKYKPMYNIKTITGTKIPQKVYKYIRRSNKCLQ